jgi:hypothetical protein
VRAEAGVDAGPELEVRARVLPGDVEGVDRGAPAPLVPVADPGEA